MTNKAVLEVTTPTKDRVTILAAEAGTTLKDATAAILGWVLPQLESGEIRISTTEITIES